MNIVSLKMSRLGPVLLAGTMLLGSFGYAIAGADDGGARSFWNVPAPGSASGMPETTTPGTNNPAAAAQPNASISRTGVAQDQSENVRPHVAVTHMGREHYAARPHYAHINVARHDVRPMLTVEHKAVQGRAVMHALHRSHEMNSNTQS